MPRHPSSPAARSMRQWPLLIIVGGVATGLVVAVLGDSSWRLGGVIIGVSVGLGAVVRVVLPNREAGLLQVRSKVFDVAVLALTGAAIITLALVVPGR